MCVRLHHTVCGNFFIEEPRYCVACHSLEIPPTLHYWKFTEGLLPCFGYTYISSNHPLYGLLLVLGIKTLQGGFIIVFLSFNILYPSLFCSV